jgi:hypothetical protein
LLSSQFYGQYHRRICLGGYVLRSLEESVREADVVNPRRRPSVQSSSGVRLKVARGCAGSSATADIEDEFWGAVLDEDVGEAERLLGQDPGVLESTDESARTPDAACENGHLGVVRLLLDKCGHRPVGCV